MTRYFALLEKEPGTLWSIWFPDLLGCTAAADNPDEAIANAASALKDVAQDMLAEGQSLPTTRTIEQLNHDPDVRASLDAGGALIAIPLLLDKGRVVRANLTVDAGSLEVIDEAARERGVSRSAFMVAAALEKALG